MLAIVAGMVRICVRSVGLRQYSLGTMLLADY